MIHLATNIVNHPAWSMYDTAAAIEDWIKASSFTCDVDLAEPRTRSKASKRPYPTPDPESFFSPKRRCGEYRRLGSGLGMNTETGNNMLADDGEETGPDAQATPRAAPQGRSSRSVRLAPSLDFEAPGTVASASPHSSVASSSSMSLVSSSSKRSRKSALSSPSKRAMLRAIPSSIEIHAYTDSTVDNNAPLEFKNLLNQILDFAEGLDTVPAELKVSYDGRVLVD
jgi:hypothetical protein